MLIWRAYKPEIRIRVEVKIYTNLREKFSPTVFRIRSRG